MSILGFLTVVIIACVVLIMLMPGFVFVTETIRDLGPFFQAATAALIVFCSIGGLRDAKWAMDHSTIIFPRLGYWGGWMYPGQAMLAFGGTAGVGLLGLADAVR